MPIAWRAVRPVITLFHNLEADVSYEALIVLRRAQLYDKTTNPRPVAFDLDVVEPPRGMTIDQRRVINAVIVHQNQLAAEKAAKNGSSFTPVSTNPIQPPLVVSWHTNEVASGSVEPVKELLQRMRLKQWKEQEEKRTEPTQFQDMARRLRAWWTEHD